MTRARRLLAWLRRPFREVTVERRLHDDRTQPGTKADRRERMPLGAQIRYAIMMLSLLVAAYATWQATLVGNRQGRDEHQACVIQARGLPAGHQLAATMRDIHTLLTLPPRAGHRTPPAIQVILVDLDAHLAAYDRLEAKQPATRTC